MSTVAKLRHSLEGLDQESVDGSSEAVGGMFTWLSAALDAIEAAVAANLAAVDKDSAANGDRMLLYA